MPECNGKRGHRQHERATRVGREHDTLTVPAIGERAGGQLGQGVGKGRHESDDARTGRRTVGRQHEQGIGHRRDRGAELGDRLTAPKQPKIAIVAQGRGRGRLH